MRRVTTPQRKWFGIPLGCALFLVLALASPVVAQSDASSRDRVPSELWKTYPLDPSKGKARIRIGTEADRQEVSPPSSGDTSSARPEAGHFKEQPAAVGDARSRTNTLSVIILALVALLLAVLLLPPAVTVTRNAATARRARRPIGSTNLRSTNQRGRTSGSSRRPEGPTRDELYEGAGRHGIEGRSRMNKAQPERAIGRATGRAELQEFLEAVGYPASKRDLVREAEAHGAHTSVRSTLERLPDKEFDSPAAVSKAIGNSASTMQ